jgi:hypothetical protein
MIAEDILEAETGGGVGDELFSAVFSTVELTTGLGAARDAADAARGAGSEAGIGAGGAVGREAGAGLAIEAEALWRANRPVGTKGDEAGDGADDDEWFERGESLGASEEGDEASSRITDEYSSWTQACSAARTDFIPKAGIKLQLSGEKSDNSNERWSKFCWFDLIRTSIPGDEPVKKIHK